MSAAVALGLWVRNTILAGADWLKDDHVPGVVSALLLSAGLSLAVFILFSRLRDRMQLRAVRRSLERAGDAESFGADFFSLSSRLTTMERDGRGLERRIGTSWREFAETLVRLEPEGTMGNGIRPAVFFNLEDLGLSSGGWRILPGLFVSAGLFFTFLGLVAALAQAGRSLDPQGSGASAALEELLTIASAKFIMSLTGLAMSIMLTMVLRLAQSLIEHEVVGLCNVIERKLPFVSLEMLATRQQATLVDQTEHLKGLSATLIAELGKPLREDIPAAIDRAIREAVEPTRQIPAAIGQAIQEAMAPAMARVGDAGASGMTDMVRTLSERLAGDVGVALSAAGAQLAAAADRLDGLAQRMEGNSGRMGVEMEAAATRLAAAAETMQRGVAESTQAAATSFASGAETLLERMTQALERIRENTEGGTAAMERAATEIAEAARAFGREIEAAGATARDAAAQRMELAGRDAAGRVDAAGATTLAAYEAAMTAVASRAEALGAQARDELLAPLGALRDAIGAMAQQIDLGAGRMARLADGVERGADAADKAASGFGVAAAAFRDAAAPVSDAAGRLAVAATATEAATRETGAAIQASARAVAQDAAAALAAAREALGGERTAVAATLTGLEAVVERFRSLATQHDEIDEKLGRAFETYRNSVESSLTSIVDGSRLIFDEHADALERLRVVVEQARDFEPESRGR